MILNRIIIATILSMVSFSGFAQDKASIKWMSITEAEQLSQKNPKKILVDVYTSWCGWCKRLDATTYQDPRVIDYINKNFYAVKFNAESRDDIAFNGSTYSYDPQHRVNALSAIMMGKSTGYPTTTFLGENLEVLSNIPGYVNADMMTNILKFFGDNSYQKMDWNTYLKSANEQPQN